MKRLSSTCALVLLLYGVPGEAASLKKTFPAVPPGNAPVPAETGWKIEWEVLEAGTHDYGGSAVMEISKAEFMRGYKPDGSEDWVVVLDNLAMAEMYVPYNDGREIFDITGYSFDLVKAKSSYRPPHGAIDSGIASDGYVVWELRDDGVRYMDNNNSDYVRRGQLLSLWCTLSAGNYRYVILYEFKDDGTVRIRVGGTAENLRDVAVGTNRGVHMHMAGWRLQFDLGGPADLRVHIVERQDDLVNKNAVLKESEFKSGFEGGVRWEPTRFTSLRISNPKIYNTHTPPLPIGYSLLPLRRGKTRTWRPFTEYDFWVTKQTPSAMNRKPPELRYIDVPSNVQNPEKITGKPVVIWHSARPPSHPPDRRLWPE